MGAAVASTKVAVVLGTEPVVNGDLLASALVVQPDGMIEGFQDKVQIDPSEEPSYAAGSGRRIFQTGPLTFGISICHEGWRYPETVRWPAQRGAQIVFHPQFHEAQSASYRLSTYADPRILFMRKPFCPVRGRMLAISPPRTSEHGIFHYLRRVSA